MYQHVYMGGELFRLFQQSPIPIAGLRNEYIHISVDPSLAVHTTYTESRQTVLAVIKRPSGPTPTSLRANRYRQAILAVTNAPPRPISSREILRMMPHVRSV